MARAAVVFTARGLWPWTWALRGYRHCEVFIHQHGRWLGACGGVTGLGLHVMAEGFDPFAWSAAQGHACLPARTRRTRCYRLVGRVDCVGVVKAALGLRSWRVLTPNQLYQHLLREATR